GYDGDLDAGLGQMQCMAENHIGAARDIARRNNEGDAKRVHWPVDREGVRTRHTPRTPPAGLGGHGADRSWVSESSPTRTPEKATGTRCARTISCRLCRGRRHASLRTRFRTKGSSDISRANRLQTMPRHNAGPPR